MGIKRIYHVGVNCTDMRRSTRFYSGLLGMHATPVTIPEHLREKWDVAAKKILGLEVDGRINAEPYLLAGSESAEATYIDLIEWRSPRTFGRPYETMTNIGIARVALFVDDVDATYERLVSNGIKCLSEPRTLVVDSGAEFRCVAFRDPDGTVMECIQTRFPTPADATPEVRRLFHINVNCTDLNRSLEFYGDTLGLDIVLRAAWCESQELGDILGLGERASADVCLLATEQGTEGTCVDLVEWKKPRFTGKPYERMNHLGIPRMAFLVDSVDGMYEKVLRKGVKFVSDPVTIQFDPPLGKMRAVCFYDPDGTVLECLELS